MANKQSLKRLLQRDNTPIPTPASSKVATTTQSKISAFLETFDNDITNPNSMIIDAIEPPPNSPTATPLTPTSFQTLLNTTPITHLPNLATALLSTEYTRLISVLAALTRDFSHFDFDAGLTLEENIGALADVGEDFVLVCGEVEAWNEMVREVEGRGVVLGGGGEMEWGGMASELLALQLRGEDAREGAWEVAGRREREGVFREEDVPALVRGGRKKKKKARRPQPPAKKWEEPRYVFGVDLLAPKTEEEKDIDERWEARSLWVRETLRHDYPDPLAGTSDAKKKGEEGGGGSRVKPYVDIEEMQTDYEMWMAKPDHGKFKEGGGDSIEQREGGVRTEGRNVKQRQPMGVLPELQGYYNTLRATQRDVKGEYGRGSGPAKK